MIAFHRHTTAVDVVGVLLVLILLGLLARCEEVYIFCAFTWHTGLCEHTCEAMCALYRSCDESWSYVLYLRVFWLWRSLFPCISVRVGVCMCALARTCVHIQQLRGILNFFSVLMSVSLWGSLYVCVFSWRRGLSVLQKRRQQAWCRGPQTREVWERSPPEDWALLWNCIGNKRVPIQLAHCWLLEMANSNAKL